MAKIKLLPLQVSVTRPSAHLFGACPLLLTLCSMHVLGNVANLALYFSSPSSHMTNFPAAAACVAASLTAALCSHWLMRNEK
jgi:hypothetical protein